MDDKVVRLPGVATEHQQLNESVIKTCEDLLEKARNGEILALAAAYSCPSGMVGNCLDWGQANCHLLISSISILQSRIIGEALRGVD